MHPDDSTDDPQGLVARARRALLAMRQGNDHEALAVLTPDGVVRHHETQELMLLLFDECSLMVNTLGDGGTAPVKVQVFDEEGEEVSIDQADPPVRTAVRTLLAAVHGNIEDARQQLEIALSNAAPAEVDSLLLQALRWTMRLSTECLDRDLPVADWIAEAVKD